MRRGAVACPLWVIAVLVLATGCASRVAPPLPATLAYAEFVYPAVPAEVFTETAAGAVDRGWRYLQAGDLANANTEFAAAGSDGFYPGRTGQGFVALAGSDYQSAAGAFDVALAAAPGYAPALVGRGLAALGLDRNADALEAFVAALVADPALTVLEQRVDLLRFRVLQEVIDQGRRAQTAGRLNEAREAYLRAIEYSPETAFLHRELAEVEWQRGDLDAALAGLERAVDLDGSDAETIVELGAVLEARGEYEAAIAAYERAAAVGAGGAELAARIEIAIRRLRDAMLPVEFHAISSAAAATRGDLAALIGVRLAPVLLTADPVQVVVTDIRTHWAAEWVAAVIRAGVIEEFPNHTYQPEAILRRVDLASAVRRVVALLADRSQVLLDSLTARPAIADVSPGHLSYQDVATAVAAGVMPLAEGRFGINSLVTGAEAIAVIERLQVLSGLR